MIPSLTKCNTLIISSKKQPLTLNVNINGTIIPNLSTTKILGVNFDNAMSWDEHVKAIRNKITKNLYLLQQIKSFLPVKARELFVNSYILTHIDYCCVIWGNCSITLVHSEEKVLKNLPDQSLMKYLIGKIQPQVMYYTQIYARCQYQGELAIIELCKCTNV